VYSRELDGEVLTFGASGWTYEETFVLFDHQTESMWYHLRNTGGMTCIAGHYQDRFLAELASQKRRWPSWFADHPHTKYWRYWP